MDSTTTFQALLARFSAFQHLTPDELHWLSSCAIPFNATTGQEILVDNRLPEYCFCLVEGRGRLLHRDAGLGRPITLALCQPGDLVGWAGLVRRHPCEWFTAADSTKLIGIKAEDFYELESRSDSFRRWLDSQSSPAELIQVMRPALNKRPKAKPTEREVLRRLLPSIDVVAADTLRILPETSGVIWLWNCELERYRCRVGELVNPEELALIPQGERLRLMRCSEEAWNRELENQVESSAEDAPLSTGILDAGHRYEDMLVPDPKGLASVTPGESSASSLQLNGRQIPVITGIGPVAQTLACLEMLAQMYGVPFRRDVVERACRDNLQDRVATLEVLGNLSTILGFTGQICTLPEAQIVRLPFPCFAIYLKQPVMIHALTGNHLKVVLPEHGPCMLPLDDLLDKGRLVRLLLLTPGRDAQRKKLSLGWFLPQIKKYRRSLIEVLVASLILQLLNLAQPLVLQQIFDKVIGQQNLDTLYTLGFVLLGVSLFQGLLGAIRTYLFADTTNRIDIALGSEVIQHLLRLPLRYFDRRPVGELQTRLAELGNIRGFLTGSLLTLGIDAIFSLIYIAVMLFYSGVLTAVSLGVIPLYLGLTFIASPAIRGQLRKAAEKNAATQALLVESLNGVQTIKAQNAENAVRWRWMQKYSTFMAESFRTLLIGVTTGTVADFLTQLTSLLTLWVGAYLVIQGELTIGQLIAFRIISGYVIGPLLNIATSWQSFQGVALSIERLSDVVDAAPEGGMSDMDQLPLPTVAGEVIFDEVDFRFNEGSSLVVKQVSFQVQAGAFIGIVGRSGSGKSTIMKLVPRFYEPDSGRILIDGFDIAKLQLSSVRRQIGIVPQDSLLFEGTIRDNISITAPDATSEEVVYAARIACAHEFIMELSDGYATRIGERGAGLSGGQRQRIAIARAVLQRPKLLILDEATSALDYITERQVCLNLKKEFEGSTVFFITHRLSTIRSSDRILMMESGSLVESGTHHELLEQKGRYAALYAQQETDLG
ncbi:peptidase domain-containing ABC transporter [Synechococcus sp. KORDI-100]|uniref:peptidase domain-containing ABC transporter n=1 Tax=Synechococcus sp. KORDI-100 TaxID=1280380 RepID=UPI000570FC9F|nr:peptidase domain-containing ABC transporter [Synechococcus sp. KORDI-100]